MKRTSRRLLAPLVATLAVLGVLPLAEAHAADISRAAVEAANEAFVARFNDGDSAGVAELYAEDGQLLPPNANPVSGRTAIAEFWQGVMGAGIKGVALETAELVGMGEIGSEIGRYTLTDGEGNVLDRGKYIVVWKQEGDGVRLYRDIWNSSMPAAGTEE